MRCCLHADHRKADIAHLLGKRPPSGTTDIAHLLESDPRAEQPLKSWYAIAKKADWSSPTDVKQAYGNASLIGNDRVVFNIGGNRYRLIVRFDYTHRIGFVRFVGTHAEYDAVNASRV